MSIPSDLAGFWQGFCTFVGADCSGRFFEAFHFDDNEADANALAALVVAGIKRATAGLAWSYESSGTAPPRPGALSVVTNWGGAPVCVIETLRVEALPFDQVSAEFAAIEGEGDGSLNYWRQVHWASFGRECARIGREPNTEMSVVCEQFRIVYKASA